MVVFCDCLFSHWKGYNDCGTPPWLCIVIKNPLDKLRVQRSHRMINMLSLIYDVIVVSLGLRIWCTVVSDFVFIKKLL